MSVEGRRRGGELLTVKDLSQHLGTRVVGRRILVHAEVASTNVVASELADQGEPEGTVVVAETQTAGRGRMGRSWVSAPHVGLWTSILLRPPMHTGEATLLSQVAALSLAEAVAEMDSRLAPRIKWPNDLMLTGKKVAGILVEAKAEGERIDYAVVGIGLNCNHALTDFPPSLQASATSLALAVGKPVSRVHVAQALYRHLDTWYLRLIEGVHEPILSRISALSETVGKSVRVETGSGLYEAFAEGINRDGSLRVRLPDGETRDLVSGDVSIR